jgi:hypothetical protein
MHPDDLVIELAKTMRELEARACAKIAALQLGELFEDLPHTLAPLGVDDEQGTPRRHC